MKDMEDKLPVEFGENLKQLVSSAESFLKSNRTRVWKASSTLALSKESAYAPESHRDKYSTEGSAQNYGNSAINYPKVSTDHERAEIDSRTPGASAKTADSVGEVELTEQFEPGVYVTLVRLNDGTEIFKRIRFRYSTAFCYMKFLLIRDDKLLLSIPLHPSL